MPRVYRPYVPQTLSELRDLLSMMMLSSPTFIDESGYFPERNIDTVFSTLNKGIEANRRKLGDEVCRKFVEMSERMRAYFESDPEDSGEAIKGRELILDMIELIKSRGPRS